MRLDNTIYTFSIKLSFSSIGQDNSKLQKQINIESLMSCHLLLNLLHELANMILCEALPSIISFLPTNVINLVINDNEFEILFIT